MAVSASSSISEKPSGYLASRYVSRCRRSSLLRAVRRATRRLAAVSDVSAMGPIIAGATGPVCRAPPGSARREDGSGPGRLGAARGLDGASPARLGLGVAGQAGDVWGYPLAPQTGQAPMPCPASTRWATEICCDLEAPDAVEEYWPPP